MTRRCGRSCSWSAERRSPTPPPGSGTGRRSCGRTSSPASATSGVELAARALQAGDLDLARWSAARALVAAPGDELLLAARIRTEHRAGNAAETERLTLQLAAQARRLGVDLDPATVTLLQEVMEGRVRARLA